MSVSVLDASQVNGGSTYTAAAGSNRVVVMGLAREPSATGVTPSISTLSWGSASLANGKIVQANTAVQGALNRIAAYHWYVKEADIPGGAQTVAATWSTTMGGSDDLFMMYTLGDVDQTAPIDATANAHPASGINPITGSIDVAAGTVQLLDEATNSNNTSSATSPWTELLDLPDGTAYRRAAHSAVTAVAATLTWALTFSANNTGAVVVTSFSPVAAGAGSSYPNRERTNRGCNRGVSTGRA